MDSTTAVIMNLERAVAAAGIRPTTETAAVG
jgi:hypothetical protein